MQQNSNHSDIPTQSTRRSWLIWGAVLFAILLMFLSFAMPLVQNYHRIQRLEELSMQGSNFAFFRTGSAVLTEPGRLLNALPQDWHEWLKDHDDDELLCAFHNLTIVYFKQIPESGSHGVKDSDLALLEGCTELESICLTETAVTDKGLEHLSELKNLEELYLVDTQITDVGLEHLKKLKKLRVLYICCEGVTDVGLSHLSELTNLETLDFDRSQVTDAGLVHLKKLSKLEHLSFHRTKVTDAGLTHLYHLTALKKIGFAHTNITDPGQADLKRALPGCFINSTHEFVH